MKEYKLTDTEARFAEIIWANNPIQSRDLVKICENEFNWKKSTEPNIRIYIQNAITPKL